MFPYVTKKVTLKSQPQTKPISMQTKFIQPGTFYASVTKTETRQSTTCQNK